jgi:CRISPR/Cas system CSM-associated protein Csm3 (group 7 of RAMP superfamily)
MIIARGYSQIRWFIIKKCEEEGEGVKNGIPTNKKEKSRRRRLKIPFTQ